MPLPAKISTTHVDQASDSPSQARPDINLAFQAINAIIDELNTPASGALIGEVKILSYVPAPVPTGWLECRGQSLSRTTYAALFNVIGTTWGSANASSFNLPNFSRRVLVGRGGTGTTQLRNGVGATGGAETVTLAVSHMPAHTHTVSVSSAAAHTHSFLGMGSSGSATTSSGGSHRHDLPRDQSGTQDLRTLASTRGNDEGISSLDQTGFAGTHSHTVSVGSSSSGTIGSAGAHSHSGTCQSTGGGGAHNNLQPSAVVLYLIHTGPTA